MGDPVSTASHGHSPRKGSGPPAAHVVSFLKTLHTDSRKVISSLTLGCKNRSLEVSTTTPLFPLAAERSPSAIGERGASPGEAAKSGQTAHLSFL